MRNEVMNLEEKILNNKYYLLEHYENVENILEQITTILDFGMNCEKIEEWFQSQQNSIEIIDNLLENRVKNLC